MKVLISAYACEPGRGSEPGAGWAWAVAAAQHHDVWVLIHSTNRDVVDTAIDVDSTLTARLHPVYLRNHRLFRPLRRGRARLLYYFIWQMTACRRTARQLHDTIGFDVVHHLTYASDWMPCGVRTLRSVPFVWGPVGGSTTRRSPAVWPKLGARFTLTEAGRTVVLPCVRYLTGRRYARQAAVVLGQNPDVARAFRGTNVRIEPNIALAGPDPHTSAVAPRIGPRVAVCAGRLIALKGVVLAIRALARPETTGWTLHIYGDGPDLALLQREVRRLHLGSRVRFFGHCPRSTIASALQSADCLILPSIRDAAGWSVAEAVSVGCPVLALDVGGPSTLIRTGDGVLVEPDGRVVERLARALADPTGLMRHHGTDRWSTDRLPALLDTVYGEAQIAAPTRPSPAI